VNPWLAASVAFGAMKDEREEFSQRLAEAMRKAGYEPRPGVLHKVFNSRYRGASVTFQTASRWLGGRSIPEQNKLQVLAGLFGVEPHALRFGGRQRVGEGAAAWLQTLGAQDRAMFDAFLSLPAPQRKLVRELVATLARAAEAAG